MKAKVQIGALVLTVAAVALLVPVAQAGPGTPGDAHDRLGVASSPATMHDAHGRVGIESQPRLLVGVDAHERSAPPTRAAVVATGSGISDSGFDWGAAAIGASSALMLALLVGISLLTARHYRGRPLPR